MLTFYVLCFLGLGVGSYQSLASAKLAAERGYVVDRNMYISLSVILAILSLWSLVRAVMQ